MNDLLAQELYKKEEKNKKIEIKERRFKEAQQFVSNLPILANWVQIEMGKTLKIIKVDNLKKKIKL